MTPSNSHRLALIPLALALLLAPTLATADHRYDGEDAYAEALEELARMDALLSRHCGYSEDRFCRKMRRHLRRLDRRLRRLNRRRWRRGHGACGPYAADCGGAAYVPVDPTPQVPVMGAAQFQALQAELDAAFGDDDRLAVLRLRAPYYLFTAVQIRGLLKKMWFSEGRLEALRILAPRLADPQNASLVYAAFPFSADRRQAQQILEGRWG